jgi:hypothetical protein
VQPQHFIVPRGARATGGFCHRDTEAQRKEMGVHDWESENLKSEISKSKFEMKLSYECAKWLTFAFARSLRG